ncbi:DedA family protein [Candidatus Babeliales bacterium]|nr:DedA family protein [Candidatus Babeliales bacterium]
MLKRIYDWMGSKVHSKHADAFLATMFFIEAIFMLPVDPLLILYCLENKRKVFYYAALATISSVLGGIAAYTIGFAVWEAIGQRIVDAFISQDTFNYLCTQYKTYESAAVLLASFTPIPYKAVTLTAGFCKLSLMPFIFFSCIGRGARFFLVATVLHFWGPQVKAYIDRWFNILVLLFLVILIFGILAFR